MNKVETAARQSIGNDLPMLMMTGQNKNSEEVKMSGYYVLYEAEYVSSNCDNIEWFETIEEATEFVDKLPKWYAYRIQECQLMEG